MAATDPRTIADAHTAVTPLAGRKAVISGGTTGIGRAIAALLASEGVQIFTCGRDETHLADGLARINAVGKHGGGGGGSGMACDLAEPGQVDRFFDAAEAALGQYDIAIINAAIPADGVTGMDADAMRYALEANFVAPLMSAHRAVAHLGNRGDIIFTGSYSVHKLGPASTVYAATKCGIHGFAEALRREVSAQGIKVGLVVPALTGADFHYPKIPADEQAKKIIAEEMLRAEDIAVAVHFMLTQPRRSVIQEMVVVQRNTDE